MNPTNRNLIFQLVLHHKRVYKTSQLKMTELIADTESSVAVAKEASKAKDIALREVAKKVLVGLARELSGEEDSQAPGPIDYENEWKRLANIALDLAGPMGFRLMGKLRIDNPGVNPKSLKMKFDEVFGTEIGSPIFRNFIGQA